MRERPILFSGPMVRAILDGTKTQTRRVARPKRSIEPMTDECPYGAPGDRLWLRETWQYADWTEDGQPFVRYAADNAVRICEGAGEGETLVDVWAQLSAEANYSIDGKAADRRWRPSIFMPRWASRLTLTITDVRVERLIEISEADAIAEGIARAGRWYQPGSFGTARAAYKQLWNSLNASRGYGWLENPFVWVVSFERRATND
jgi:hypothetical protein